MQIQEKPVDLLYDTLTDYPWDDVAKLVLQLLQLIHEGHSTRDCFVCLEPRCVEARDLVGL